MHGLASLLMIAVTASWIAARQSRQRQGDGLEWALLSVLPATAALLVFLESGDTQAALRLWAGHLALAALALGAWSLRARAALRRPAWTMVSIAVLAAGLLWNQASAQDVPVPATDEELATIPVAAADPPPDELPADPAPVAQLEAIVVTGEKLGRSLSETATSVGLVTREDLQASSDATMKDVVTQFANVISASGDRELAIRGVPQNGIGGEGETISVYLDGVALPPQAARFAGPLSAWDLEQVEVLRGAQSTNQGRNSLAGSVILRSRAPTPDWDLRLRAGAMSRGGHDYAIAGGGPISESLGFRIAAQDRYDNGDIVNLTRNEDDAGRERLRNARAKLAWTPAALPGYRAQYGYTESNNEFGDPLHDASGGERTEASDVRGNEDDTTRLHSLEQSYAFGDGWRLDAISGHADIENFYTIDFDRSAADGGSSDNTLHERILSQELRLHYAQPRFRGVVGLYYADADKDTGSTGYDVATGGGVALANGTIVSAATLRTQALFAEADWDFAEAWRLTVGARYNQERSRRNDASELDVTLAVPLALVLDPLSLPPQLVDPLLALPVGVPLGDAGTDLLAAALPFLVPPDYEESGREDFDDLLPKVGLTWFTAADTALALTYQEGYRSGGTSISFFGGAVSPFDPEYTRTVELSLRTRGYDDRLRFNANAFYTRWRDQQVTIGETSGFATTTENAGRSHYYGLETEALWAFEAPFEIFATLGLLRSEFDEFINDGEDYAGNEFPYAPDTTAGLGLTLREWRRLSGQITVNYIAAFFSDPDNDPRSRADARTLLNVKLGYRLPAGFSLSIYGRNLTDDPNEQGALVVGERLASRYGEPRSFGAVLEWQL